MGEKLRTRPFALLGNLIGAVIFLGGLTYVYVEQNSTDARVDRICNGYDHTDVNREQCNKLFDRLLQHPTESQVQRLQELLKENQP